MQKYRSLHGLEMGERDITDFAKVVETALGTARI